jgi:hypothetical protein
MMFSGMFSIAFAKRQIIWAIVISYAIFVMNRFFLGKPSSNDLFHNKSMLKNISKLSSIRMIGSVDIDVSIGSMQYPAPPFRITGA